MKIYEEMTEEEREVGAGDRPAKAIASEVISGRLGEGSVQRIVHRGGAGPVPACHRAGREPLDR